MRSRRSAAFELVLRPFESLSVGRDDLCVDFVGSDTGLGGGLLLQRCLALGGDLLDGQEERRELLLGFAPDLTHPRQRVAALVRIGCGLIAHDADVLVGVIVAEQPAEFSLACTDLGAVLDLLRESRLRA